METMNKTDPGIAKKSRTRPQEQNVLDTAVSEEQNIKNQSSDAKMFIAKKPASSSTLDSLLPCTISSSSAIYSTTTQTLTISVQGQVNSFWFGYKIKQVRHIGTLKFDLDGRSGGPGPVVPAGSKPSTHAFEVSFDMPVRLPLQGIGSKYILLATAEKPAGVKVDIVYDFPAEKQPSPTAPTEPSSNGSTSTSTSHPPPAPPQGPVSTIAKVAPIITTTGHPFEIKAGVTQGAMDAVDISFDDKALVLSSAAIQGGSIVWTFAAVAGFTGRTLVEVTTSVVQSVPFPTPFNEYRHYLVDVLDANAAGSGSSFEPVVKVTNGGA
ncbi:hypothetical protein MMC25_003775 [Agyrium rufum]|nr:hypothetical protein [Agyrium rufum]